MRHLGDSDAETAELVCCFSGQAWIARLTGVLARHVQAAWALKNLAEDDRGHGDRIIAAGGVTELIRQVGMCSRHLFFS